MMPFIQENQEKSDKKRAEWLATHPEQPKTPPTTPTPQVTVTEHPAKKVKTEDAELVLVRTAEIANKVSPKIDEVLLKLADLDSKVENLLLVISNLVEK